MCGISGAINYDNAPEVVRLMTQAMIHRGPDSNGFLDRGPISLGMRRLRIIDLATGDQPIYNEDGSVAIIFNGEIYNFLDLYRELQTCGHQFKTRSDTEVIVHAYEEWGNDCPAHLRGMFAFAIYDQRVPHRSRVFMARDRLGIKPLYVRQKNGQMLFASEVRALLASGHVPRHLSEAGLYTYLAFGSVQEPLTMIDGITSLPPATWLKADLDPNGLVITSGSYWKPTRAEGSDPEPEQVRAWLTDAVQSHLISDVPMGLFLSGGLDSGTVVALASESTRRSLHTLTLAFDNWPADERYLTKLSARRWNTNHQERLISSEEVLSDLPMAMASMDQPTADGINTWYVSREAKKAGLTVALSGVGGDELFAGYSSFRQVPRLKNLPKFGWPYSLPVIERSLSRLAGGKDKWRKLGAFIDGHTPFNHPYFAVRGLFTSYQIDTLLQPKLNGFQKQNDLSFNRWRNAVEEEMRIAGQYDSIGEVSWLELSQYMLSTLLRDADAMGMAHSLEIRVPFVDHRLIEQILVVRGQRKMSQHQRKPLLVSAMRESLPPEVVGAVKKTFTFPFESWLRDELSSEVRKRLHDLSDYSRAYLDLDSVGEVWRTFERGQTNWSRPWALYILDAWLCNNL